MGRGGSTASEINLRYLRGRGGSRELLQLQQQVGGRCLVRRGGMCHSPLEGRGMAVDGCTNDRRPVVNGRITLHGDDARCVYGRVSVTH